MPSQSRGYAHAIEIHALGQLGHLLEGASRYHDQGWPLSHGQELLGYATIQQTSTYLNVQKRGLLASMLKSDDARSRCNPVVTDATTEHPTDHNETATTVEQVTVN